MLFGYIFLSVQNQSLGYGLQKENKACPEVPVSSKHHPLALCTKDHPAEPRIGLQLPWQDFFSQASFILSDGGPVSLVPRPSHVFQCMRLCICHHLNILATCIEKHEKAWVRGWVQHLHYRTTVPLNHTTKAQTT